MVTFSRKDAGFDFRRVLLQQITPRVRSTRPLVHKIPSVSITHLRRWGLLRIGETNRCVFGEWSYVTTLARRHPTLRVQGQDAFVVLQLVSRPLRKGLVWYFQDPLSRRLVTSVYFTEEGLRYGQKAAGALYASQFQTKTYRQVVRMHQLISDINGDPDSRVGRARGASKLRNFSISVEFFLMFEPLTARRERY